MNWYKKSQVSGIRVGNKLTYNYPKAPYRGTCRVEKVNGDGTLDVLDMSGRIMSGIPLEYDGYPMFKEKIKDIQKDVSTPSIQPSTSMQQIYTDNAAIQNMEDLVPSRLKKRKYENL